MFGLMRRAPRLAYCGTCKTMGALYGEGSRFLLNHDAVFLGELLMAQTTEPAWGKAYRSFNCFALPRREAIPPAMEYAATAAVAMAHFHIADQREDTGRIRWWLAARLFSRGFRRAAARLKEWRFPLEEMTALLKTQKAREGRARSLAEVAEPTAAATALMFSHGARVVGNAAESDRMYRIGHRFGYLVYVLDACEDRERDAQTGQFNALAVQPGVNGREEVLSALAGLDPELPAALAARLRSNVEERLGMRPRVIGCGRRRLPRWTLFATEGGEAPAPDPPSTTGPRPKPGAAGRIREPKSAPTGGCGDRLLSCCGCCCEDCDCSACCECGSCCD